MKVLSKFLVLLLFPVLVFAGAYRDTYEVDIQREIYQINNEIEQGTATDFEIMKKAYLEKRLSKLQTIGVARIILSTGVKKREPIDNIDSISYTKKRVYLFTEIENMKGKYVTHVWYYNENPVFKKRFKIKGSSWRIWTSKKITKYMVGNWRGVILDDDGNALLTKYFIVTK